MIFLKKKKKRVNALMVVNLRLGSSCKGMEKVCGSFQVQVPLGTKILLIKKIKNNNNFFFN